MGITPSSWRKEINIENQPDFSEQDSLLIIAFWLSAIVGLIIAIIIFTIIGIDVALAEDKKYLQTSNIDPKKKVIYGTDSKTEGWLQKSHIDPRKTIQYDSDGEIKGYWQKSYIDPRKTIFIEKD